MGGVRLAVGIVLFSGAVLGAVLVAKPETPLLGAIAAPARAALGGGEPAGDATDARAGTTLYQYTDAKGVVRFVKRLEDVPPALRARAGRVEMDPAAAATKVTPAGRCGAARAKGDATAEELPAWRRFDSVVLYTASWCGYCRQAIEDLEARRVDYTVKQIDTDIDAKAELKRKTGGESVPQLFADGRHVVGYDRAAYDALFGPRR